MLSAAPPNLSLAVDVHVTGGRALIESQILSLQTLKHGSYTLGDGDSGKYLSPSLSPSLGDEGRHRHCSSCSTTSDLESASAGFPDSPTLPRDPGSASLSRTASTSTSTSTSSSTAWTERGLLTVPTPVYSCQSCSCPPRSPSMLNSPMSDHSTPDSPMTIACQAVRRMYGRPDVHRILEDEVTTAQGAVAVDGESRPEF